MRTTAILAALATLAITAAGFYWLGKESGRASGEARAEWWRYESMIHQGEAAFCKEIIGDAAEQAAAERAWQ